MSTFKPSIVTNKSIVLKYKLKEPVLLNAAAFQFFLQIFLAQVLLPHRLSPPFTVNGIYQVRDTTFVLRWENSIPFMEWNEHYPHPTG